MGAKNRPENDVVQARRERVASLRARGRTMREIASELAEEGIVNPDTLEPYSLPTIKGDIDAIRRQWQGNANQDTAAMVADQLAEIAEVKRAAWGGKRLDLVLRALEREAKLQGLDAPTRIDLSVMSQVQQIEELAKALGMNVAELLNELITELVSAKGSTADAPPTA